MLASKTIKCRIQNPTQKKQSILENEFEAANEYLRDNDVTLYSATKQAMDAYTEKVKENHKYPLFLRNDTFKFQEAKETEWFDYWFRLPTKQQYGGVWLPVKPHTQIDDAWNFKDSKIVRKDGGFELHLHVEKKVEPVTDYNDVLAVDLGERVAATAVLSTDRKPRFYGRDIRGIRRHYAHLRRKLQTKELQEAVERIGKKESRTVKHRLHEISKQIVSLARKHDACILLGDVKTGGGDTGKGKRMNRLLNSWAVGKLRRYIKYKAKQYGIAVYMVNERNTSKTCYRCKSTDTSRPSQGRFKCKNCGLDHYNSDANAANNILDRFLAYMVRDGADSRIDGNDNVTPPETHEEDIKIAA